MREIGYKIKLLAIGILFILNLVLFLISHFPPYAAGNVQEGKPQRMAKQLNLYGRITDIAVCHDYLYVLYGDLNILECRTLDGAYLHAYCVDMGRNGEPELQVVDDTLWLITKRYTMYAFRSGEFLIYYGKMSDTPILSTGLKTEEQNESDIEDAHGNTYRIEGASVWRLSPEGKEEILHRPVWYIIFQHDIIFLAVYALCIVSGIALWRRYISL